MNNKELKNIYNEIYTTEILNKKINCFLIITKGDKFDIVKIKDSVKNEVSIGELTELLMKEIINKWSLKQENLVWIEDFSEVNETTIPNENLSLIGYQKNDNNYIVIEKNKFTEEEYNDLFLEINAPKKRTTKPELTPKITKPEPAPKIIKKIKLK